MTGFNSRLHAAEQSERAGFVELGTEAGRKWAAQHAEPKQLRALDRAELNYDLDRDGLVESVRVIGTIVSGDDGWNLRDGLTDYGLDADALGSPDCLEAFVTGALEVWHKHQSCEVPT